ncbi:glycosyltransferase [uncultured Sphingomonas sp.]|uniref:glycosyltransferase n=1 Tax=uncultured Sphingomonas sp. TaxID=158754 RepID=UPI0025E0295F|nr:glycosyltransferase [uncultured Sphingomonas sp.]
MTGPSEPGPLKLQIYVGDLGATGVVRNALGIANAAAERGWAVRLLTSRDDGALRGEVDARVEVIALLGTGSGQQRKHRQRRALLPYRRQLGRWRPDVLFSAGNHGHLLSTLAWHGAPGCKVLRISNALESKGRTSGPLRRWKFQAMVARADRLVLVSHALARDPLLAPLVASGKAVVIPNGVDVERVRREAAAECPHPWLGAGQAPVVLAVGRHVAQKNFALLLEGFAIARQQRAMRLLFLGEGIREAIAPLQTRATALGVEHDVGFVPPVSNPFPFMREASLFALPSLWEGSSNVLLEALACGTPIVASRTAGDAELILDRGRFGLLAYPADPAEWADAILRQLSTERVLPADRADRFSRQAALASYLALLDECGRLNPHP